MLKRALASFAFIAGGLITWLVIATLQGLGASQAGMSAGPLHGHPARDTLFVGFLCSYFAISALAMIFCRTRKLLWTEAAVAYFVVLFTFVVGFIKGMEESGSIPAAAFTMAIIYLVYFAPWTILWLLVIANCEKSSHTAGLRD
jgi:hypothetical protein